MTDQPIYTLPVKEALVEFGVQLETGLTSQEVQIRRERYGFNELLEKPRPGFLKLLFDQLNNFLIIILIVAAVISIILGEYIDAVAIIAIVALNATLGVVQESKAEAALAALKKMAAPSARVLRDGHPVAIPAAISCLATS